MSRLSDHYDGLSQAQLINLLRKRDRQKKYGLVWERKEIEADAAIDANFIACTLDQSLSDGSSGWRNLVIESDNYDALRWLRMAYAQKVKCIYIDPPYNTGNKDWVYNDHYVDAKDAYRHSTWLEFLYRRLDLARDLLASDGVILVSINDENRAKLEMLMDEALPGMRLGSFVWRTRTGGNEGGKAFLTENHEHVLAYGNSGFRFCGTEKSYEMYKLYDEKRDDWYRPDNLTVSVGYLDKRAGKAFYPLYNPQTDIWYPCNPDAVWRYASREISGDKAKIKTKFMEEWIAENAILFPDPSNYKIWHSLDEILSAIKNGEVPKSGSSNLIREDLPNLEFWVGKKVGFGSPAFKRYKKSLRSHTQPLSSWITPRSEEHTAVEEDNFLVSGTNDEGAKVIKEVFGEKAFNYAKPVSLIRELVRQSTGPDDLVLDFFAGSATTAHAVMELNAEDNGSRRFIMVSSTEATASDPDKNLCRDVTAERIRKLNALDSGKYADLQAEFAYLRTREIDFDALNLDLRPSEAWSIIEARHGLPLTQYDSTRGWNEHGSEDVTIILSDRADSALIERIRELADQRANLFVYSWAPGQIRNALEDLDIEILPVRETLVRWFTA